MRIQVTRDCIKNGEPESAFDCPVALALKKKLNAGNPGNYIVNVGDEYLECFNSATLKNTLIKAPRSVTQFVRAFDKGKKVKPFTFILKVQE